MIVEDDQSFCVEFVGVDEPTGFSRSDAIEVMTSTSTVTIKDDDSATCSLSLVSECVPENTDVSICILCDKMFEDDGFEVALAYSPKSAVYDNDYTSTVTMTTYPSATTTFYIHLAIVDDLIVEDDQSFCIEFTGGNEPSGFSRSDAIEVMTSTSTVTIKDDDSATCSLSLVNDCVEENTDVSICIRCDKMFEDDGFELSLAYSPKSAVYDNDYTSTVTMTTYPSATTMFYINLDIVDDMIVEDDQSFCIEFTDGNEPSGFSRSDAIEIMTSTSTVTIKDDDSALAYSPKSAVYDNDYTSTVTMTTYPSATTTFYIDLSIVDDMVVEDDQSFCIEFTDGNEPSGFSRSDAIEVMTSTSTVTIKDDDSALAYSPKSAVYDNDYTSTVTLTTYPSATTTFYIDLDIVDDMIVEDDQSFCIELAGGNEPSGFSRSDAIEVMTSTSTVTIKDDDSGSCFFSPSTYCVSESDPTLSVTFTCDSMFEDSGYSVTFTYIDGDATEGNDFTVLTSSVGLLTTGSDVSFAVSILPDIIVEDDQSFTIGVSDIDEPIGFIRSGIITADSSATVTVKDDDTATCSLSLVSDCVTEDTDVSICILCDKMFEDDGFELSLAYSPKSAVYDSDYTSTVTLTTYPSATTTFYIDLDIVDDMIVEDDQSFCIEFTDGNEPSGFSRSDAIEVMTSTSTVTIKDNDSATCSLSLVSDCVTEDTDVSICILCDKMFEDDGFEISLAYTPKSAVYGNDYTSTVTMTTYPLSTTTFYIDLDIVDDMIVEDDQSLCIELAGGNEPSGFSRSNAIEVMTSTSTVTIKDDDSATCSLSLVSDCVTEDTDVSICILCDRMFEDDGFELSLAYTPKSALYGNDYTSTVTMTTYPSSSTTFYINLDVVDDMIVEDDQSFCIELAGGNEPSGFSRTDAIEVITSTSTVTIKDDDSALAYTPKSAVYGNDYTSTVTMTTYPSSTTTFYINLDIVDDMIVEDDQSFCIEFTDGNEPSGFSRSDAIEVMTSTSTVTIKNDDSATCYFVTSEICLNEDIGTYCPEVICDNEIEESGVSFLVSYVGVTANEPDDYTTVNNFFEFTTSTTSLSFCGLSIEDDEYFESDEYLTIDIIDVEFPVGFADTNAVIFQGSQTVTIKNDDPDIIITTDGIETTQASTPSPPEVTTDNQVTTARGITAEPTTAEGTTAEPTTPEATTDQTTITDEGIGNRKIDGDDDPCKVSNPCPGYNMICSSANGVANCTCMPGYEMHVQVDQGCRDTDECLESPCLENQHCINLDGSYECICHVGYQMTDESYCEDINECMTDQHNCMISEATVCENTIGNFTCSCIDGHVKNSSGDCIPIHLCDPIQRSKCQFPEDLCFVDESGESFCACSPGFARSTVSSACENKNECTEIPDVCKAIKYSQCIDDVPTMSSPDDFYHCKCMEGYVEIAIGRCVKELVFRVGMDVVAVNGNEGFSLWSEDLVHNDSETFRKTSELFCSFFEDAILSHPEVNKTECSGLGFAPGSSDLQVAIIIAVVPTKESIKPDVVRKILVISSQYSDTNILVWEKANGDSISIQDSSLDVQVLGDISCSVPLCNNGGTCIMDTVLYQVVCRCNENYTGAYCEINAGKGQDTPDTSVSRDDSPNVNIGLIIPLAFALLVLFSVFIGMCFLLLKPQRSSKVVSGGHSDSKIPKERPVLRQEPNVVRNPGVGIRNPSQESDQVDYDEKRLRLLQQSFTRMGGSSPAPPSPPWFCPVPQAGYRNGNPEEEVD
ncbi:Hemicentin-1 [Holothuria leucospilota]|uniref:Hemicentin-1 n=1 Tax=Holothuria leucospilota TaxID=206669 RepID=A0A9Q1BEM4_HOLLE|nr:Hemicentin-1 [Holothuria leucospilota]